MKSTKELINVSLNKLQQQFGIFDEISLKNTAKVLDAFAKNNVALRHFNGTSGYGNDDIGRDTLCKVYADVFGTEAAIVSPLITSGTHAITVALFGVLRPHDIVLSVTGQPYDTLCDAIYKEGIGSLADFGVHFNTIDLTPDNRIDLDSVRKFLLANKTKMVYIQRSRGYAWRPALSIAQIEQICHIVKSVSPETIIFCDNCYGEFVEDKEPTNVGADFCAGSLIKNIGGGIAPTGGYVCGRQDLIDLIAGRVTSPSVGMEVGSYTPGYRLFYQGLFNAPHVVNQALKVCLLFAQTLTELGYDVLPKLGDNIGDIVCSVKLGSAQRIIDFCKAVQSSSPVDAFVSPEPWEMPGYNDKVIMAAGCFVQGASIELSCDGPIREPYIVYLQGGLTLEHGIIALQKVLENLGN